MKIDLDNLLKTGTINGADGILAHRYVTIQKCLHLFKTIKPKIMVETGCQHNNLLHAHGMSTTIFAAVAEKYGGELFTVDINKDHLDVCKQLTEDYKNYIEYIDQSSLDYFQSWQYNDDTTIDFLYLDSYDFHKGIEEESRLHQLREIVLALPLMSEKSVILLDDANVSMWFQEKLNEKDIEGKTYYSHRYLLDNGAKCLIDAYQRLYLIEK